MLFGRIKNINNIFEHLVPQGTPAPLIPVIVCVCACVRARVAWVLIHKGNFFLMPINHDMKI
jgi:hypothetical protein